MNAPHVRLRAVDGNGALATNPQRGRSWRAAAPGPRLPQEKADLRAAVSVHLGQRACDVSLFRLLLPRRHPPEDT